MIKRLLSHCGRIRREEGEGKPPSILSLPLAPEEQRKGDIRYKIAKMINPSNADVTFILSTRTQRFLKTILTL